MDRLLLEEREGRSGWERALLSRGEVIFTFLTAGEYRLTLCRCGRRLCRLEVHLAPGGNAEVMLDGAGRCYGWRQNRFHSLYNRDGGTEQGRKTNLPGEAGPCAGGLPR